MEQQQFAEGQVVGTPTMPLWRALMICALSPTEWAKYLPFKVAFAAYLPLNAITTVTVPVIGTVDDVIQIVTLITFVVWRTSQIRKGR